MRAATTTYDNSNILIVCSDVENLYWFLGKDWPVSVEANSLFVDVREWAGLVVTLIVVVCNPRWRCQRSAVSCLLMTSQVSGRVQVRLSTRLGWHCHLTQVTVSCHPSKSNTIPVQIYIFFTLVNSLFICRGFFRIKEALYPTHFANIICRNYSTGNFSLFYSAQKIFACKMHKLSVIFTSLLHPCFRE